MKSVDKNVVAVVVVLFGLLSACSEQSRSSSDTGHSIFTAITDQDIPRILEYRLDQDDAREIAAVLIKNPDFAAIMEKIDQRTEDPTAFLLEFADMGGGGWANVMHSWGMIKYHYDSLQLNDKVEFSPGVQRYTGSAIYFTMTDTLGVASSRDFAVEEVWMIDGELKILDW